MKGDEERQTERQPSASHSICDCYETPAAIAPVFSMSVPTRDQIRQIVQAMAAIEYPQGVKYATLMREKVDGKEMGVAKKEHCFVMAHTHEFYLQEKKKEPRNATVKDCSAKEAMIRSVCSVVSSISHIVFDKMYLWFKYAFDRFYKCPNDVKNNIFHNCYDDNGNQLPHPGVTILPEIVGELSPPVILDMRGYLPENRRDTIYKRLKQDAETLCKSIGKSEEEEERIGNLGEKDVHQETKEVLSSIQRRKNNLEILSLSKRRNVLKLLYRVSNAHDVDNALDENAEEGAPTQSS